MLCESFGAYMATIISMLGLTARTVRPSRLAAAGNRGVAILTRFCTSSAATSMLVPILKVTLSCMAPLLVLLLCIYSIPGEPFTCSSIGVATVCSTVWASAPINCPFTCTTGGVISGYWSIGSSKIQTVPVITSTIEITIAVTGRFIKVLAIIFYQVLKSQESRARSQDKGACSAG